MFLNQAELQQFVKEWEETPGVILKMDYHRRYFIATFEHDDAEKWTQRLLEKLEETGNYGYLYVTNENEIYCFGSQGRMVCEILEVFDLEYQNHLYVKENNPYEDPLEVHVRWGECPSVEFMTHDEHTRMDVVIASVKNKAEAVATQDYFKRECQLIADEYNKIEAYLKPFLDQHIIKQLNNEYRDYEFLHRGMTLSIHKTYHNHQFLYEYDTFLTRGHREKKEDILAVYQREIPLLIAFEKTKETILNTIWTYDPYGFYERSDELYINEQPHNWVCLMTQKDQGYVFLYRLFDEITKEFDELSDLLEYALQEMKKELAPLRLKGVFSKQSGHMTRIRKMYGPRCNLVFLDPEEDIHHELNQYFKVASRRMFSIQGTQIHSLGNVFVWKYDQNVHLSLSKEKILSYVQEEEKMQNLRKIQTGRMFRK